MIGREHLWVVALAVIMLTGCPQRPTEAPDEAEQATVHLPQAGLALSLPEGYERQYLHEPFQVLRPHRLDDGQVAEALTVSAYPVPPNTTAELFTDEMLNALSAQLLFRNVEPLAAGEFQVASQGGHLRVISYRCRDVESVGAVATFVRPMAASDIAVCYVFWLELPVEDRAEAAGALDGIVRTVTFEPVVSPLAMPVAELGQPLVMAEAGCSIRPPAGWFAVAEPTMLQMAQVDLAAGGVFSPRVILQVDITDEPIESATCSQKSLLLAQQIALDLGDEATIVHQGPADLGPHPSYEFALMCRPGAAGEAPSEDAQSVPICIVERALCLPPDEAGRTYSYYLTLIGETADVDVMRAIMARVAAGFSLVGDRAGDVSAAEP